MDGVFIILEWLFLYEWKKLNGMDDWRVHMVQECGECTSVHKGDFDGKYIYYFILMQLI